ncbi:MAG: metallophosphoesterase [candidate division Zixibacteria bacterium]|jgi:predicted MPP superfamily phosphohydrolase|nr:metallophosphoesterase [candidate division Zixibacteria bacterium]
MSRVLYFGIFLTLVIGFFGLLDMLLLRLLNREWWAYRWIRRLAWSLPVTGIVLLLFWGAAEWAGIDRLSYAFALFTSLVFVLEVGMVLALFVSGVVFLTARLIRYIRRLLHPRDEPPQPERRLLLKRAAAAAPVIVASMGVSGMARSFSGVNVELQRFRFSSLPTELEGFRILHLSDLHLREYVTVADLEDVLTKAESLRPDLVLVTGDVADDLRQLPDALRLIDELRAPYGAFASLGNHEYFRGVDAVRRIHDASTVPLLVDRAVTIATGTASLRVAGIDDPRRMGTKQTTFFERAIDTTLERSSGQAFTVLMSHRPDAFDHAARRGIELTLAGHTHGGQIGLFGRSLFEPYWPDRYLWGHYRKNGSQLYTSSGVGHWFPFRLGCPPEAPVIELTRA